MVVHNWLEQDVHNERMRVSIRSGSSWIEVRDEYGARNYITHVGRSAGREIRRGTHRFFPTYIGLRSCTSPRSLAALE